MTDRDTLIARAFEARESAYAPYSGFRVGACLRTPAGKLYTGCNVENASLGVTCCAERSAVFQAVAGGDREFTAIAIAAGEEEPVWPCGACLQVLREFSGDLRIITASASGIIREKSLRELLPYAFSSFKEGNKEYE